MRQVSLREFRTRGSKALEAVPNGETVLLADQKGPAYFLIPALGDVILEDRELRRTMAKASLRKNWRLAEAAGAEMSDEEIDREINQFVLSANAGRPNETGCPRHKHHRVLWDQAGKCPAKLVMDWVLEGQIQVSPVPGLLASIGR
jgi:antitoxin (DNA-binding transcriptional repressor) of toxin-antitoxin stability system